MRIQPWKCILAAAALTALSGCFGSSDSPTACTPAQASVKPAALSSAIRASDLSHVPPAFRDYSDEGRLADESELDVSVALPLNHEDELDERIAEVYQAGNPQFHHFLKPEEFRVRYAPTSAQVAATQQYLTSHGLTASDVAGGGYLIHAHGTAAALGEAFGTEIHSYRDRDGQSHYGPANEPSIPSESGIQAVNGLSDAVLRSFARPSSGNGITSGGLTPQLIQSTYGFPTSLNGAGQTIALVELDGYTASDITAYTQSFGLPTPSIRNVTLDGFNGAPGANAAEVSMDIELVSAIAPGAQIVVYEGPNSTQTLLDIFTRIANDNQASQVSVSWGVPEPQLSTSYLQSENAALKQLAVQGQAVFAATGDQGAYDNGSSLSVQDPASEPFVVAVGGTHLNSISGSYSGESVWNGGSASAGASGGGVSAAWSQPSWQNGVAMGQNLGSTSMRNVPDVSLNADPDMGYSIVYAGGWAVYGGTSASSPIWAAFLALVNQNRAGKQLAPLGFPNPALYSIGKGSQYSTDFHDVNDGNNLYYPGVPGFDDATGWGSPNGQSLFEDLSNEPAANSGELGC